MNFDVKDNERGILGEDSSQRLRLPLGVPPLTSLYLYITGSCNLACKHCWISPNYQGKKRNDKFVELEYVKKALKEAIPLGLTSIKVTGGEPFLHPEFRTIAVSIDRAALNISIETNGTLVDRKLAAFLWSLEHKPFISISVDGIDPDSHEWLRGVVGCFKPALTGIKNLVDQGFKPQLICTLHKRNVSQIKKVIQMAEKLGCGSVKFNHVQQIGRGKELAKEIGLSTGEIVKLYKLHIESAKKNGMIPISFDIPFAFRSIHSLAHEHLGRCTVKNILGLLSDGNLSLCGIGESVPELIFGHIQKDNLSDLWFHNPQLLLLRDRIPGKLEGVCSQCVHRDLCMGLCVAHTYYRTKNLTSPHIFCQEAQSAGFFPVSRQKGTTNRRIIHEQS